MQRKVHTVDPMTTVREALQALAKHKVSSLVIERRDKADELGLIVVSDIAREVIAANKSPDRVNIYEIMSKPVLTLDEGERACLRTFADQAGGGTACLRRALALRP